MDRRNLLAAGLAGSLVPALSGARALAPTEPDERILLWPMWPADVYGPPKNLSDHILARGSDPAVPDRALDHVRTPRLDVFRAREPNGSAMLVIPGGGYSNVVFDKEGYEIGRLLATRGITAFVLMYRLPGDGWFNASDVSFADAQRGIRTIRAKAAAYSLDPKRVGVMGFSAGGHICAELATRFSAAVAPLTDSIDSFDPRPMIAAPIYPVVTMEAEFTHPGSRELLIGKNPSPEIVAERSAEKQVTKATPPCFLMHAEDDPVVPIENTLRLRAALKKAGVPVETHLFEHGGHGFGLRGASKPVKVWPELFLAWAKTHGLFD